MYHDTLNESREPRPTPAYVVPFRVENEVSLVDIWQMLARRKVLILLILLASLAISLAYLFLAEPVYIAKAYLQPPSYTGINGLSIDRLPINPYMADQDGKGLLTDSLAIDPYTPQMIFEEFLRNFRSQGLRRKFFNDNDLATDANPDKRKSNNEVFEETFNKRLVSVPDTQDSFFVSATFRYSDPALSARWLNQFIDFVDNVTTRRAYDKVSFALQSEIKNTLNQLESRRKIAGKIKHDEIARLEEALGIANSLNIIEPTMAERVTSGATVNESKDIDTVAPLYLRGLKRLQAEIITLKARKFEEPYIQGFRELEERLAFLEAISIDDNELSSVRVDEPAYVPEKPEKPRRALVLAMGLTLGLLIGIPIALFYEFATTSRPVETREDNAE